MNESDELTKLREARDRLAQPGGWNPAEPPQGMLVNILHRIYPHGTISLAWNSLYTALDEIGHRYTIMVWERMIDRQQEEVVALLDRAIQIAEQTGDCLKGHEMTEQQLREFSRFKHSRKDTD